MRKSDRQRTSFTTHFTMISPQKHHILHRISSKTPAKQPLHHNRKKQKKSKKKTARQKAGPLS
jgi:hypothetical protein